MKTYSLALPDEEAAALDANISVLRYAFPDLNDETALLAIIRTGSETIYQRLRKLDKEAAFQQ